MDEPLVCLRFFCCSQRMTESRLKIQINVHEMEEANLEIYLMYVLLTVGVTFILQLMQNKY